MILAASPWLTISINLLLVVFLIVCLLLVLLVLMQRPKQEGLGAAFGGGLTDQVFGARTTNVLQRGTVYLGSLFFILSLTLSILYTKRNQQPKLGGDNKPAAEQGLPAGGAPAAPAQPASGQPKSLLEELEDTKPVAPAPNPQSTPAPAETPTTPAETPAAPAAPSQP